MQAWKVIRVDGMWNEVITREMRFKLSLVERNWPPGKSMVQILPISNIKIFCRVIESDVAQSQLEEVKNVWVIRKKFWLWTQWSFRPYLGPMRIWTNPFWAASTADPPTHDLLQFHNFHHFQCPYTLVILNMLSELLTALIHDISLTFFFKRARKWTRMRKCEKSGSSSQEKIGK